MAVYDEMSMITIESSAKELHWPADHRAITNEGSRRVTSTRAVTHRNDPHAGHGVEFIGFVFRGRRATINVSTKSIQKFKRRIREVTGRSRGISMDWRMGELRTYLRGWLGYFGLAAQLKLFVRFDQWIRRRIRMCYWKPWRYPRTRLGELIRLGVPRRQAIRHAKSRRGPWRMSKPSASGVGMTNAWLEKQGLISLKPLWKELAPLRRTA